MLGLIVGLVTTVKNQTIFIVSTKSTPSDAIFQLIMLRICQFYNIPSVIQSKYFVESSWTKRKNCCLADESLKLYKLN